MEAGRALGRIDPEITAHALTVLRREGVRIIEQTKAARAEHWAGGIRLRAGRRRDAGGIAPPGGRRTHAHARRPRPRRGRHQVRPHGHPGGQGHAHLQPPHLRHRRLCGRAECGRPVHPCRQRSCRHRRAPGAVPAARQGQQDGHAEGRLHGSGDRAGGPLRGGGRAAFIATSGCCAGPSPRTTAPRPSA